MMCPALDPTTQVKNGNCWWGITLGVPPKGGGGPGCFPLVRFASRRFGRRAVDSHQCAEMSTIVDKTCQIGSFTSITTKHRSDRRAAE
jgi:hypothetical protein